MTLEAWDEIHGRESQETLERFLDSRSDSFAILQLKPVNETTQDRFMGYSWLKRTGREPETDHYEVVYSGNLPVGVGPEDLYRKFNLDLPPDFTGHSLSVSDILALRRGNVVTCLYTDTFGFQQLDGFLEQDLMRRRRNDHSAECRADLQRQSVFSELRESRGQMHRTKPVACCRKERSLE